MCLALLAIDAHPRYALVIAANRDEYHARPTAPAAWWDEGWLAGRDLEAGGTWLGIRRDGRFALLTNFRDPSRNRRDAPSRGALVPAILASRRDLETSVERIRVDADRHNGFNLLAGTPAGAVWTSNRSDETQAFARGAYGLSNALLDTPWPKLARTKTALAAWLARADADVEPLFAALGDRGIADDAALPSTGVPLEWERRLSAPFIVSPGYGTRSSTIVTIDRDGEAHFVERSFDAAGEPSGEVDFRFGLAPA
jgi:uncharacterized protein with NRDE domain